MSTAGVAVPAPAPAPIQPAQGAGEAVLWFVVAAAVVGALGVSIMGGKAFLVVGAVVAPLTLVSYSRALLSWRTMLGFILAIILFIPIRRYTVGGGLPFELEPYRIVIAVVLGCWFLALLADPDVRWRPAGLEAPIILFAVAILLSLILNLQRVTAVSDTILKQITFFVSYFLVLYFVSSILSRGPQLDRMLRLLVGGGTIVAVLALVEWRTGTNMFNGLGRFLPFLHYVDQGEGMIRGTGVRALGSAQHPIALGAALVMLLPLTVYLHRRDGSKIWLASAGLLTLGALSTGSRTAAVMLIVTLVVFFWLKRDETVRLIPTLLVLMVVIQGVMPGTLGTFKAILNPAYVVKEQSAEMGTGSGRIADLGPSLDEWSRTPALGQGFGTRIPTKEGEEGGAQILDNQWLGTLLEIGAIGALALLWIFVRGIRRLARRARADTGADGWLATTLAASLTAFAVGMLTFDAFAFIQVTFFAFVVLGFSAVVTHGDGPLGRALPVRRPAGRAV